MYIHYAVSNLKCVWEWDFTAQVVWWYYTFAHLRGNTAHEQRDDL